MRSWFIVVLVCLSFVAACGKKGPLYLPEEQAPEPATLVQPS